MKVIPVDEMKRLDRESPVSADVLMERAGEGMADYIQRNFPIIPVCFVCGMGNNGGDGFVAARRLHEAGREVEVYLLGRKSKLRKLPEKKATRLDLEIVETGSEQLENALQAPKIVCDCIFGTGFRPPLNKSIKDILEIINRKSKIILSCDIPTGVNGNSGEADPGAVNADVTLTFEYPKTGHIKNPGSLFSGSVDVVKINTGLSPKKYNEKEELTVSQDTEEYLKRRPKDSHKKMNGHVLVIGGAPGMEGAVSLAALGALRAGAGLVTCAVTEDIYPIVASASLSSMELLLEDRKQITLSSLEKIIDFSKKRKIDCAVLGPGMGTGEETRKFVKRIISDLDCPMVIDADGLNNIASCTDVLKKRKNDTVITPHPGEMARLAKVESKKLKDNRESISAAFASKYGCTVVLKGYRSIITKGRKIYYNSSGNPGMATGGSGDILSGVCAASICSIDNTVEAARISAWIHGHAGDKAAWKKGQRYMLPEDMLNEMKRL